jgi:Fe2+ transport system protein FeoA
MGTMGHPVFLHDMAADDVAIIGCLEGEPEVCQRLESMGLCCGAMVRMVVPGCPCAVQVGECRLMLRHEMLRSVRVEPLLAGEC